MQFWGFLELKSVKNLTFKQQEVSRMWAINGLFYVDRLGGVQTDGSEISYGTLIYDSERSSFFFIHHYFGVVLFDSYDSKLSHPPSLYIYLPFSSAWNQFSVCNLML